MKNKVTKCLIVCLALCAVALTSKSGAAVSSEDCLSCHDDPTLANDQGVSLNVDPKVFEGSIHGEAGIECGDCHDQLSDIEDFPHESPVDKVDCSMCHDSEFEDYKTSVHGEGFVAGDKTVPVCSTCHGKHNIRPPGDPQSLVFPINLVDVCLKCHTDTQLMADHNLSSSEKIKAYESSVHMKALKEKGLSVSATCNDCHGSHKIKPPDDPTSITNRLNLPKTCAKCHQGVYKVYLESVHGQDYLVGNEDVPICTDCHGEHTIKAHTSPDSSVYATHIGEMCSKCHEDEILSKKYGFSPKRIKSFLGTYHGIAASMGDSTVANCASCHGFHDIRPSADPKSSVHPDNIPATCGKCHPQAGKNFAIGKVHVAETRESSVGAYFVEKIYMLIIGGSVSGFLLFIIVDLYARRKKSRKS